MNNSIREELPQELYTGRGMEEIPERLGGSDIKNTSRNIQEESYEEIYQIANNATFGKVKVGQEDQRRPFSPPIKQKKPNIQRESVSFKQESRLDQDDAPPLDVYQGTKQPK